MRMAAIQEPVRPGIEDQMIATRRSRDDAAARRQRCRRPPRFLPWHRTARVGAANPVALFRRTVDSERWFAQEHGSGRERVSTIVRLAPAYGKQLAAVIVADLRAPAAVIRDRAKKPRLAPGSLLEHVAGRVGRFPCRWRLRGDKSRWSTDGSALIAPRVRHQRESAAPPRLPARTVLWRSVLRCL